MGIGAGIFLVAVGAILTFAVDVTISGLDIAVVGVILMAAGAAGILLDLTIFAPRRRRVVYEREHPYTADVYDDGTADRPTRVRRRVTTDHRPMR
jgi:hypothetical protein